MTLQERQDYNERMAQLDAGVGVGTLSSWEEIRDFEARLAIAFECDPAGKWIAVAWADDNDSAITTWADDGGNWRDDEFSEEAP